jgi:DNA repair protein RecO (recombination protein O)
VRSRRYSSEGIVLARRNYSEADRILVVYTKHFGKLSLMAKGVRKPKSRKRGAIEVFSQIKFAAARGKSLDIVTEVEIIDSFNGIRDKLKKASVAFFFMEAVGRLTREDEENKELYVVLVDYLKELKTSGDLKKLRLDFIFELLTLSGFWPKEKELKDPDGVLEDIIEREMASRRIGKQILS